MFTPKLWTYARVSFRDLDSLPDRSGIYYAVDRYGDIRYVGKAVNLCDRWRRHNRYEELKAIGCVELRYRFVPRYRLLYEEAIDVQKYQPDVNIQHPDPEEHKTFLIELSLIRDRIVDLAFITSIALVLAHWFGSPLPTKLVQLMITTVTTEVRSR